MREPRIGQGEAGTMRKAALLAPLLLMPAISCSARAGHEVEVEVRAVSIDRVTNSPVVVLESRKHDKALPIWIGPFEAQAIAMGVKGVRAPRPLTHDLMKTLLERVGARLEKVVVRDLKKNTYYARIYLSAGRKGIEVDSRPSDAIALALRFRRPIFVDETLFLRAKMKEPAQEAAAGAVIVPSHGRQGLRRTPAARVGSERRTAGRVTVASAVARRGTACVAEPHRTGPGGRLKANGEPSVRCPGGGGAADGPWASGGRASEGSSCPRAVCERRRG